MSWNSVYPVLLTSDVGATTAFYRTHFGYAVTFEADWYVSLQRERWELGVLDKDHLTIPKGHRGVGAAGILINIEVDDVDAEYERLVTSGSLDAVLPIRSEDFGQRHFIVAAPDGVLIDVISPIDPVGEFAAQFS